MIPALICLSIAVVITFLYIRFTNNRRVVFPVLVSVFLSITTLSVWYLFIEPNQHEVIASENKTSKGKTIDAIIEEIQDKLRQDRNNSDLWFQLGQGYFANGQFESASTCFGYVLRLEDESSSTVYAAKATADYYIHSQRITEDVQRLIDKSLSLDKYDDTALMLIANDHFISFRYKEAIRVWQSILDSERPKIDRVRIINSINRTKEMMVN
mgnify:CR=1 FL=1